MLQGKYNKLSWNGSALQTRTISRGESFKGVEGGGGMKEGQSA